MKMNQAIAPIGLQLYSIRELCKTDFMKALGDVAAMGYKGVELAGLHGHSASAVKSRLNELQLIAFSSHLPLPTEENIHELAEQARILGFHWIVSGLGPDAYADRTTCLASAKKLQAAARLAREAGFGFAYHNHEWEFDHLIEGKLPFEIILDNAPDVHFEMDTYWVTVGKASATQLIQQYHNRIPMFHIKDGPAERGHAMVAVGQGKLQWAEIFSSMTASSVDWVIVEFDQCDTDILTAVDLSRKYLVSEGYGMA